MEIMRTVGGEIAGKKYELTEQTINARNGAKLYRIRALRDIPAFSIKKGNLGGYVESEDNLSHDGNSFVFHDACVYGNATVSGDARVLGDAEVFEEATVLGNACVHNRAKGCGAARVQGATFIYGKVWVGGSVAVSDAFVKGKTSVAVWEEGRY